MTHIRRWIIHMQFSKLWFYSWIQHQMQWKEGPWTGIPANKDFGSCCAAITNCMLSVPNASSNWLRLWVWVWQPFAGLTQCRQDCNTASCPQNNAEVLVPKYWRKNWIDGEATITRQQCSCAICWRISWIDREATILTVQQWQEALDASINCAIALWVPFGAQKTISFMVNTLL